MSLREGEARAAATLRQCGHDLVERGSSVLREITEGTEEWDLLHKRYYAEELKKLGIDLAR